MANRAIQHRRLQNMLLIQKLLTLREGSSPFTLLLDSVEQSAKPLIRHFVQNAKISKIDVIFLSFETLKPPPEIEVVIKGRRKSPAAIQREIISACAESKKTLLVIDTLYPLASLSTTSFNLPDFLSSFLSPQLSILAAYHVDIPIPAISSYAPHSITLLKYLATTILTAHSFPQTLARKRAAEKSLSEPVFGIAEESEGVILGIGANDPRQMAVEMEYRRKSGRGVVEWFCLPLSAKPPEAMAKPGAFTKVNNGKNSVGIILLEDHPLWQAFPPSIGEEPVLDADSTFELGLTAKQREDREGVVLPYFDAQKGEGGEGGRILYDMGVEDDFDEEEDEI